MSRYLETVIIPAARSIHDLLSKSLILSSSSFTLLVLIAPVVNAIRPKMNPMIPKMNPIIPKTSM